jgi:hypothetical protein
MFGLYFVKVFNQIEIESWGPWQLGATWLREILKGGRDGEGPSGEKKNAPRRCSIRRIT